MKFSIITATKNSCKTIERAIVSFISQNYKEKELIIIDANSTDCTLDVITKYRQYIDVFLTDIGRGIYAALNQGIKVASGDVIGVLHSDDFWADNNVLTDIAEKFNKGADVVYGDVLYVFPDGKIWRYWRAGKYKHHKLWFGWMPPHTTFFVRSYIYQKYGLYREDMKIAADYEMILRILKHQPQVEYLPRILTIMTVGGESNRNLKNILQKMKEDRQAARINGLPGWSTVFFKNIRKIPQLKPSALFKLVTKKNFNN